MYKVLIISSCFLSLPFISGCSSSPPKVTLPKDSMALYIDEFISYKNVTNTISKDNGVIIYKFTLVSDRNEIYFNERKICDGKTGEMIGAWCVLQGTEPLYYIKATSKLSRVGRLAFDYILYENSGDLSVYEWKKFAVSTGFLTKDEMGLKIKNDNENASKKIEYEKLQDKVKKDKEIKDAGVVMKGDVGTIICKEDKQYNRGGYKGYIEDRGSSKLKVRLFYHGTDGMIFNDVEQQPIIWTSPLGWYVCK